ESERYQERPDNENGGPEAGLGRSQIASQKSQDSQEDAVDEEQAATIGVDVVPAGVRGEGLRDTDAVGPVHGNAAKDERQREGCQHETEAAVNENGWNDHGGSSESVLTL